MSGRAHAGGRSLSASLCGWATLSVSSGLAPSGALRLRTDTGAVHEVHAGDVLGIQPMMLLVIFAQLGPAGVQAQEPSIVPHLLNPGRAQTW